MTLSENWNNTPNNELDSSLKKIFWEDFEKNKQLKEVLDTILKNKETPAHREFLIKNSSFTQKDRSYLYNINAGVTLGKFAYSQALEDYETVLKIIKIARGSLWKSALVNWDWENTVVTKVTSILDWVK